MEIILRVQYLKKELTLITELNNSDNIDTQLITQSLLAVVVAEYIEICLIQSPPFLLALICGNLSLFTYQTTS